MPPAKLWAFWQQDGLRGTELADGLHPSPKGKRVPGEKLAGLIGRSLN